MQNQPPKQNMWTMILLFMTIFLGLNLLMNSKSTPDKRDASQIASDIQAQADKVRKTAAQQNITINAAITELKNTGDQIPDLLAPHDKLNADQDMVQMRLLNGLVCDMSIAQVESQYERALDNVKGLTPSAKQDLAMQAQLLVDDTQLKAAGDRREMVRLTQANDNITRLARYNDSKPIWKQAIEVSPTKGFPATRVTPDQLTTEINFLSTDIGKNTQVWGFFPGYQFVNFLVHLTGGQSYSYWIAALMLAVFVRGIVFPIAQRQMMWSRQMQQLSPLIKEIKDEYKNPNDPTAASEIQQKTMALYKEYGINPLAGCLPAFLQMPLFLLIYNSMLNYRVEFKSGTFLWINPSTSALSHGFIARNLGEKDYILIVIYAISMITTAMLAPVADPTNMKQQRMMGIAMSGFFGIVMFFWPVPSAFVLYWIFTNTLATAQSYRAYRLPLPPLVKKNAPNGGVFPSPSFSPGPTKEGLPANGTVNGQLNGKPKSTGTPKIHKPKKKK
jgi:YidC/Oxa1 family membrane protein insertase